MGKNGLLAESEKNLSFDCSRSEDLVWVTIGAEYELGGRGGVMRTCVGRGGEVEADNGGEEN